MVEQVVSKKRVADYGEVYTCEREVNAMLDLVEQETLRIESRFLEPASVYSLVPVQDFSESLDKQKTLQKIRPDSGRNRLYRIHDSSHGIASCE